MKKQILFLGTIGSIVAPILGAVACGKTESNEPGMSKTGIFTEYVRSHDLVLSLGVVPQWHARSDLNTTHDRTNEGYLDPFAGKSNNGKRYLGGDKEYFSSLGIKAFIARSIDDKDGKLSDVETKWSVQNSETTQWEDELTKLAGEFDGKWSGHDFVGRSKKVIDAWNLRKAKLESDSTIYKTAHGNAEQSILFVRGDDDNVKLINGVIPSTHLKELLDLDSFAYPTPTDGSKLSSSSYSIDGKDANNKNLDLAAGFANSADIVVYLQTPNSTATKESILSNQYLNQMKKANGKILVTTYDNWYMPFRGAAIGANVVMDNIEKDLFGQTTIDSSWKDLYKVSNLITSL